MYLADACSSTWLAEAMQGPRGRLKQSTGEAGLGAGSQGQGRGAARRDFNGLTQAGCRGSENVGGGRAAGEAEIHRILAEHAGGDVVRWRSTEQPRRRGRRKARLAQELEGAGAMALSDELLLLDADIGSQGTELEEDCTPAVED